MSRWEDLWPYCQELRQQLAHLDHLYQCAFVGRN